jgi:hypothetical protein
MSSNASEARRLRPDRRKRSKDHDISNHKYTCWDEQALHVDTNVQRKRCLNIPLYCFSQLIPTLARCSW